MFYFDSDKSEIKNWIRDSHSPIDQRVTHLEITIRNIQDNDQISDQIKEFIQREINKQIIALNSEIQSQFNTFKTTIRNQTREDFQDFNKQIEALQKEILALRQEQRRPPDYDAEIKELKQANARLQAEIEALQKEILALRQEQSRVSTIYAEINELKLANAGLQAEIAALRGEIARPKPPPNPALESEVANLKNEVANLKNEVANLKKPAKEEKSHKEEKPVPTAEEIFYLKANDDIFIPCDRKFIPVQIRKALNVADMENFLIANDSETSKKFQRLIKEHLKKVKSFVEKLNLSKLEDEELSETITNQYFKLFQSPIFDNLIVSIKSGLIKPNEFYNNFLKKLNTYLENCGIYTLNVKSGEKASDEDYKNMSPQIIKTADKSLVGKIKEIDRLPYRINYLDEFGDKQYLQYNGVMMIYKER